MLFFAFKANGGATHKRVRQDKLAKDRRCKSQNLQHHPHVHCVVPGGGLSVDGERWIACRPGFFLLVRVLSSLFRRLFLAQLQEAFDTGQLQFFNALNALQSAGAFARYLAPVQQVE